MSKKLWVQYYWSGRLALCWGLEHLEQVVESRILHKMSTLLAYPTNQSCGGYNHCEYICVWTVPAQAIFWVHKEFELHTHNLYHFANTPYWNETEGMVLFSEHRPTSDLIKYSRKVFLQNIMMSQSRWYLTIWIINVSLLIISSYSKFVWHVAIISVLTI